jgi:large repetitive protein
VVPPNVAPSGADKTVTTLEDTGYAFAATDFGFSDTDANSLQAVKISTLPTRGTLTDNGVAVIAGQFIAVADITGGKLVFTPAVDANGASYASFTFQVQDNGGTANGGVDTDATPNSITVDVTSVNDAPTGANKTVTTAENSGYTFSTSDFGFADAHDSPANNLLAVEITALPANGTLTDNGVAVTAGQFVSVADITGGKLVFTPVLNASGTSYASFDFKVQDNGGTANGGVDTAASATTITVNVTPTSGGGGGNTNHPPAIVAPAGPLLTAEDTSLAIGGVSVSDADNDVLTTTLTVNDGTISVGGNGTGVSGDGTATLVITGTGAQIDAKLAALRYTPKSDWNGDDKLGVVVTDTSNASASSMVAIHVDDADVVNDALTTAENTPVTANVISGTNGASADIFEDPSRAITSITQGAHGAVSFLADGTVAYTPDANFVGVDSFTYTVSANDGAVKTGTVTVTVTTTNPDDGGDGGTGQPPANSLQGPWTTDEDVSLAITGVSIIGGGSDMLTSTVTVMHGTLSAGGNGDGVSGDGTATLVISGTAAQINVKLAALGYKPIADYNGPDTLEISTKDGVTVTDFGSISVRPVADIVPDALTTVENIAATGNLLANDNFEGSPVVTGVTQGAHGQVAIGAGGNVTYTPAAGYVGADSFTYTVTSPAGVTETSVVTVQVAAIDPIPARADIDPHLTYAPPPSMQAAPDGKVSETKNLVYVQPVVRHEPLSTDSLTPVETEIHAVQKEAMLLGMAIDKAATPEQGSPLFDSFGLSAPKTEFVSPVQRAAEEHAKDKSTEKSSQADTERVHVAPSDKPAVEKHQSRVALAEVKAPRRAAPSFAAQLRRGSEMLRAAPRADRSRP